VKKVEIRITGLGGQGVVLAGQILGRAAIYDGQNAVQTQSYGAEARGSAAKSEVIISDDKIGFPMVRKCNILIAMNQGALDKNLRDLKEEGILIVDCTNVKTIPHIKAKIFKIPATEKSEEEFGTKTYANMIMLGALTKIINVVTEKAMEKAIEDTIEKTAQSINKKAFEKGRKLAQQKLAF